MLERNKFTLISLVLSLWLPLAVAGADDFVFGIGTHDTTDQGLALIQAADISSLRDDIHWAEVEQTKGVLVMPARYETYVNEALSRGIQPVLILCYGNPLYDSGGYPLSAEAAEGYTEFAEFVAGHFAGRVRQYEIWNEWNIGTSMPPGTPHGNPEAYVALLQKVYPRLKTLNPDLVVVGGALSGNAVDGGWLEDACKAGLLDSLDAFSFHPYCYRLPGEGRLPEDGFVQQILDSQGVTQRYQKHEIPILITEVGWTDYDDADASTPQEVASFLARTYLLARTMPFVQGLWWYDFCDDGVDPSNREYHFGIVDLDLTPKPAYSAMSDVCQIFGDTQYVGQIESDADIYLLQFSSDAGNTLFALWSSADAPAHVIFSTTSATAPAPVKLSALGGDEVLADWTLQGSQWQISVPLGGDPQVLETDAIQVAVTWAYDAP